MGKIKREVKFDYFGRRKVKLSEIILEKKNIKQKLSFFYFFKVKTQ